MTVMPQLKPLDVVQSLGTEAFLRLHPRAAWPRWLEDSSLFGATKSPNGDWKFAVTVSLDAPLNPDESWEMLGGNKVIVRTNPVTGERRVVISRGASTVITVFEAMVDPVAKSVSISVDNEPSSIEFPAGLEP